MRAIITIALAFDGTGPNVGLSTPVTVDGRLGQVHAATFCDLFAVERHLDGSLDTIASEKTPTGSFAARALRRADDIRRSNRTETPDIAVTIHEAGQEPVGYTQVWLEPAETLLDVWDAETDEWQLTSGRLRGAIDDLRAAAETAREAQP